MLIKLIVCIAVIVLSCSGAYSSILTFDGVPSGTMLHGSAYAYGHRVFFSEDFQAIDHIGSAWGYPYSGSNVLVSSGNQYVNPFISFGYITTSEADRDDVQAVCGYFSTNTGSMVRITAYQVVDAMPMVPITSIVIGAPGESWNNRYVEITTSPNLPFNWLEFEGVNSSDDLLGFCVDDMTIVLVPEPSSLLALAAGLVPLAGLALRRRRK